MKLKKFIKYWWHYNTNSLEPSGLFILLFILMSPLFFILIVYNELSKGMKESKERRKQFFNEWNNIGGKDNDR